jgi:hypothetical protein
MSTRSAIGILQGRKITGIYAHYDGYLSHNGVILLRYYDEAKTKRLVSMGDLSTLGTEIGEEKNNLFNGAFSPKAEGTTFPKICRFYNRDYGEKDVEAQEFNTKTEFYNEMTMRGCDYIYLMLKGKWLVKQDDKEWMDLDKALVVDTLIRD